MDDPKARSIDRKARFALPPQRAAVRPPEERRQDFAPVLLPMSLEQARAEASRCLHCTPAPCQQACPLNNAIPVALGFLEDGDPFRAARVYLETNPFPAICGRICPATFCEEACVLARVGKPLDTRALEAFVADEARRQGALPYPSAAPGAQGQAVAVVGSGPAGLAVADYLARRGYQVHVYERYPFPGGLLRYGIPGFKLEPQQVVWTIADLEALGVTFHCNVEVGREVSWEALREQFAALFLGLGTQEHGLPDVPGQDLPGIYGPTEFLVRSMVAPAWLPEAWRGPWRVGPRVHVLGGGDTAMDCLRTALRLPGVQEVTCYYRRSEAEMPAHKADYTYARQEGARFEWLTAPVRFEAGPQGRVARAVYQRMVLGAPDASGRRRPEPLPGSEFSVEVDTVVLALGYQPVGDLARALPGLRVTRKGLIEVDEAGRTSVPGVFAAGDVVHGADLAAPAIAAALRAARAIEAYLQGQ